jgi:hypothetical protein
LPTNNRPGWKGLPGANTLAYYKKFVICVRNKFYNVGLGMGIHKNVLRSS